MDIVIQFLNSIHPLEPELNHHLGQVIRHRNVKKSEFLLMAGQVCTKIYFIESGMLRAFCAEGEKEKCCWFMQENDVVISVESFLRQVPSHEWIQALEDCSVYYISYREYKSMCEKWPSFNFIRAQILEAYYIQSEERLRSMRSRSAVERYHFILERFPTLLQRVQYRYIASYLGLTDEHFCRIRASDRPTHKKSILRPF